MQTPIVFDTLEYQQLVDQFYEENKDLVTPVIHRACRENYEFFMTIVEQALNHCRTMRGATADQASPLQCTEPHPLKLLNNPLLDFSPAPGDHISNSIEGG